MPSPTCRIAIICHDPPPAEHEGRLTEFGLQDALDRLHAGAGLPGGALRFDLEARVKEAPGGAPDFAGPFVHGPRGGRFAYLGWRTPGSPWIRRYKIPLAGITWALLETGATLVAEVSAATRLATLPIPAGWAAEPPPAQHG